MRVSDKYIYFVQRAILAGTAAFITACGLGTQVDQIETPASNLVTPDLVALEVGHESLNDGTDFVTGGKMLVTARLANLGKRTAEAVSISIYLLERRPDSGETFTVDTLPAKHQLLATTKDLFGDEPLTLAAGDFRAIVQKEILISDSININSQTYYLALVVDDAPKGKQIIESDENNNVYVASKEITIRDGSPPEITATSPPENSRQDAKTNSTIAAVSFKSKDSDYPLASEEVSISNESFYLRLDGENTIGDVRPEVTTIQRPVYKKSANGEFLKTENGELIPETEEVTINNETVIRPKTETVVTERYYQYTNTKPLVRGAKYEAVLTTAVADKQGNHLNNEAKWDVWTATHFRNQSGNLKTVSSTVGGNLVVVRQSKRPSTFPPDPNSTGKNTFKAYLIGGTSNYTKSPNGIISTNGSNVAQVYDSSSASFKEHKSTRTDANAYVFFNTRHDLYATATSIADDRILVAGGYYGDASTGTVTDIIEISEHSDAPYSDAEPAPYAHIVNWKNAGKLNTKRWKHTATLLNDGRVLIAGGQTITVNGLETLKTTEILTIDANGNVSVVAGPTMKYARVWHTATLLGDGRVLILGGSDGKETGESVWQSAEIFDPNNLNGGPILVEQAMPYPRKNHVAVLLDRAEDNTKVLVAGGYLYGNEAQNTADIFAYNPGEPQKSIFTRIGNMRYPRAEFVAIPLLNANGKVAEVLIAGEANADAATSEIFDPITKTFGTLDLLGDTLSSLPRQASAVSALPDGKVLIVGGKNKTATDTQFSGTDTVTFWDTTPDTR